MVGPCKIDRLRLLVLPTTRWPANWARWDYS